MKRGKQVGIWGGSRAKKGRFRRALRLDAGRCGLPLRPSALHHSSCGLDTPALSGPALRRQRRPRPPGSVAAAARRPLALGVDTVAARGSGALGVDIVAVRGSGALGSWHSFGSGSFGLDTAVALTPLVRPLGSPALTPLVQRLCSGAFGLLSGALPRAMRVAGSLTTGPL